MRKRWDKHQTEALRKLYSEGMSFKGIAETLGRTTSSVVSKAFTLGILRNRYRFWTSVEDEFLREKLPDMPVRKISLHLNRSSNAVQARIRHLGLRYGC